MAEPARFLRLPDLRDRVLRFSGQAPSGSLGKGVADPRSQSYDHCYNYFADTPRPAIDMEKSCAVLGFYLASWGMYRGSSYLFNSTNSSQFRAVVTYIEESGDVLRAIDVDGYGENGGRLQEAFGDIQRALKLGRHSPLTLVTKILVGVFGCVPAYDTYVCKGIRHTVGPCERLGLSGFGQRSLDWLSRIYQANAAEVTALAEESKTWRFEDAISPTGRPMTKAKILDMYLFDRGLRP